MKEVPTWQPATVLVASVADVTTVAADANARVTVGRRDAAVTRSSPKARPRVELLWFGACPNHPIARALLDEIVTDLVPGTTVRDIDATDPSVARRLRFPGSPTIRIDGRDVDPSYEDPGDYAPRCRLYRTAEGLRSIPDRTWIEAALRTSVASRGR